MFNKIKKLALLAILGLAIAGSVLGVTEANKVTAKAAVTTTTQTRTNKTKSFTKLSLKNGCYESMKIDTNSNPNDYSYITTHYVSALDDNYLYICGALKGNKSYGWNLYKIPLASNCKIYVQSGESSFDKTNKSFYNSMFNNEQYGGLGLEFKIKNKKITAIYMCS